MVNLLELNLRNMAPDDSIAEYSAFALVDHSRPGVNDQLPGDLHVDIVIDHHPPRGPVPGEFVDLRQGAGATSTILTEYLEQFDLEIDAATATALLYGIRVDTNDFTREVSPADFRAASVLWPHVDTSLLRRIEQPSLEGETLETIARAIKNRIQRDSVAVASVGRIGDRDALPQAADQLLAMEASTRRSSSALPTRWRSCRPDRGQRTSTWARRFGTRSTRSAAPAATPTWPARNSRSASWQRRR